MGPAGDRLTSHVSRIPAPLHHIRRHIEVCLRDHPPPPDRAGVLVACSGGPDSLALAAAAAQLNRPVGAVVVDHGLQPGSAEVAREAARKCAGLGLAPVTVVAVDVAAAGRGPEAAARLARYGALEDIAAESAAVVLLGHTLDDQAETVLLGLGRGSGTRSIAGMAPSRGPFRRPLLAVTRAEIRDALEGAGLVSWEDPHNADPAFLRSRVRGEVMPVLDSVLGPRVNEALARTADLARDDADALDGWAADVLAELGGGAAVVADGWDVLAVAALPAAVRRRVLRQAALTAGCPGSALRSTHLRELDRLVADWRGQGPLTLPGGVSAHRRCGRLFLTRRTSVPGDVSGARDAG